MGARKWFTVMLSEALQNKLANLPEHGMDSQVCDLTLRSGKVLKQVIVTGCRSFSTGFKITTDDVVDAKLSY